jgi:hypothetical protein
MDGMVALGRPSNSELPKGSWYVNSLLNGSIYENLRFPIPAVSCV